MQVHRILIALLCTALLCGCGKTIAEEIDDNTNNTETTPPENNDEDEKNNDEGEKNNDEGEENEEPGNEDNNESGENNDNSDGDNNDPNEGGNGSDEDDNNSDPGSESTNCLTIAEAQALTENSNVWVQGYIVGVCKGSTSNTIFEPPFEETTAIVLADVPCNTETIPSDFSEMLFPVQVNDYKLAFDNLHLSKRPELHNKQVKIYGLCTSYMKRKGMKKVLYFLIEE